MRVLVISPYPVWPPVHGGRVRTAGLARGLAAAGAEVTLLSPWHPRQPRDAVGAGVLHRVHALPSSVLPAVGERVAPAQALLSLEPLALPRRALRRLGHFDAYQFEFCAQARWMSLVPPAAKVVYSAHNVEADYLRMSAHRHLVRAPAARRIRALEGAAVARADLVVTCTAPDAERLAALYGPHRFIVAPNGSVAPAAPSPGLRNRARARLGLAPGERAALFVGGPGPHNREAVEFLALKVAPRLRSTRLVLAGAASRGMGGDGVIALGYVPALAPLLAAADVGVNPVAYGSGSSVKVASYLGSGLSVLATPMGALGFGDRVTVVSRDGFAEALDDWEAGPVEARPVAWGTVGDRLLTAIAAL